MKLTKLSNIFEISYGNSLELNRLETVSNETSVNFVSRTAKNNGISAQVKALDKIPAFNAGLITVAVGGSVLETFLQPKPFYTGYHVMVLNPKRPMTDSEKIFYCTCIRKNKYRYNYGRQANRTLKDIEVPSKVPNWVLQSSEFNFSNYLEPLNTRKTKINLGNWQWFTYDQLFEIERGRGPRKQDLDNGQTPFITATDQNNGLTGFTSAEPIHNGNVITVNRNGSVAEAFYQTLPFCSTEDVHVFNPKFKLNIFVAFFLIPLIRKEKYRYSYGRKWGIARMKESLIKLPTTKSGQPDFNFMERYIKTLPYSKQLEIS